ncbi:Asp-tRNA(Asn)/Glu-tRNA(Gln) amidotransferase GatCAB subunit A [Sporanaerobium hydrogeniformans]|uniref:Asp-tRNA(Asn)/Glu-tRNA(Gln) amidotransferase GatCAB subunit A n=1 Tax=Sporanaerobium hydrogeniformans TaxID=3072179 RepID=A0AC61DD62_9FIRM|nr:Asp-tRNA(Asn)/Glu-tRNA(Gln) amidotransferase subunit GatA [Sporanaerobium hydrogeniformans]PHV70581.1 Asp-tRNA(Asn)/Glu-tRNA(Gln) amidotransferase GatCAB subunit A [Sporanaerobium hydrogeniformans]
MELCDRNIAELRTLLDSKELSSVELTRYYLNRIEKIDAQIDSYITVCADEAIQAAKKADERIAKGQAKALTGIPISIKDNMCIEGIRTTCGSKMLESFIPPYSATVIHKLLNEQAVILGKTSMDEFAMGGSTQTSYYKKTKNPHDLTRVPGGSSGGSAAAVAARLSAISLGSDTGGSIRQPAAFCGITGMKPTYGSVSRFGLIAFGSSLDQIGPMAHSAKECATILNTIGGYDCNDGTSSRQEIDFESLLGKDIKGMIVALPKEFFEEGIDKEVRESVLAAAKKYEEMGVCIEEVSMPSLKYAIAAYYLLSSAEASSNLSRYDGIKFGYCMPHAKTYKERIERTRREGFGDEVKRRILLGTYALSSGYYDAYYKKALYIREKIKEEYNKIFERCDVMLTPTAPTVAFKRGAIENDPVKMYLADICTVTVNIAGLPGISTTCGYDKDNMPIGMSIIGKAFDDAKVIQVADAFEKDFIRKAPSL